MPHNIKHMQFCPNFGLTVTIQGAHFFGCKQAQITLTARATGLEAITVDETIKFSSSNTARLVFDSIGPVIARIWFENKTGIKCPVG